MNQILGKTIAGRTLGYLFKNSLRRNNPHGYSYLSGKSLTILILLLVNCTLGNAQSRVKLIAFQAKDVKLNASWILEREALNTTFIGSLDADRLLHNFRVNAGLPSTAKALEGWESPNIGLLTNLSIIDSASFQLKDGKHVYTLRPFYGINNIPYGVYASIREY
ncbi:beta-L-arabinofuranosidase domain-containing protein [Pedobacter sp. 22163]|uniref:beta-L-arabinofuranosidase domain-containing protein n=1 Tax=Pedobacter sp. 22163 TaxID=3453883 RepID=UPI003F826738